MTPSDQLIAKWRPVLDATEHIYTKTGDAELCYWAEEAKMARRIVEIGTLFGRSAKVMLLANPSAQVFCIDAFYQDGTYETAKYFLREEILLGRCLLFRGTASEGAMICQTHESPDMVMLDNGHEQHEVEEQIELFLPLLRSGGLICGHDLDRNPDNGVTKAVKKLLSDFTEPVSRVWAWRKP